ncbi:MAG: hypothetical protein LWX54_09985 [Deltaproteobacteria bacterium]|jgi:hypothetical protein|nr:hypothetical protein [Deltaproteobacteria bacterium]
MIRIDHICIKLPHSMQSQATVFAEHLADAISRLEHSKPVQLKSLSLPSIKMNEGQNVNEIATQVAKQIHHFIDGG